MNAATRPDDPTEARLRGFGPLGIVAMVVIVLADTIVTPLSGMLVLLWAWRSHTPWREIGYVARGVGSAVWWSASCSVSRSSCCSRRW